VASVAHDVAPEPTKDARMADPASNRAVSPDIDALLDQVSRSGPLEAVDLLGPHPDDVIVLVLSRENPAIADEILWEFPEARRQAILQAAPA
jgi:hypothetical protein